MVVEGGFPVEDLHECPPAILDSLPFGVIRTTGDGRITFYSRTESSFSLLDPAHVTGKNFFRDVAPCTRVKEFAGELEEMRLHKQDGRREFAFVFRFPGRSMLVSIVMVYQAHSDVCTLLVRPVAEE